MGDTIQPCAGVLAHKGAVTQPCCALIPAALPRLDAAAPTGLGSDPGSRCCWPWPRCVEALPVLLSLPPILAGMALSSVLLWSLLLRAVALWGKITNASTGTPGMDPSSTQWLGGLAKLLSVLCFRVFIWLLHRLLHVGSCGAPRDLWGCFRSYLNSAAWGPQPGQLSGQPPEQPSARRLLLTRCTWSPLLPTERAQPRPWALDQPPQAHGCQVRQFPEGMTVLAVLRSSSCQEPFSGI